MYRNGDFCREVNVVTRRNDSLPVYANGRISFEVTLEPCATWHACLMYELGDGKVRLAAPPECIADAAKSKAGKQLEDWKRNALKIKTNNGDFNRLFHQSIEDIAGLRLPIERTDHFQFIPAGGVPWFVNLFGRDSLVASLKNTIVHPEFAMATLDG